MTRFQLGVLPLSFFFAALCQAEDTTLIEQGRELSQYCVGCHGIDGRTDIDSHPRLAGQNQAYLESALKAYRNGNRRGELADIMRQNARGLSDQEIRALAAYYASL